MLSLTSIDIIVNFNIFNVLHRTVNFYYGYLLYGVIVDYEPMHELINIYLYVYY